VCRRLSRDVGALVVSVDYRLAPVHAYPAALEDCAGALEWVRRDAAQLDVDPSRIAVAGDSAGGNLAAALALLDRGNAIPLAAQVLLYPLLDATMDDPWARSYRGPGLQLRDCHELRGLYLGEQAQAKDELVSPLLADSLEGLPATLVVTAGVDVLRDQGRRYAERLLASGVPARWSNYPRAPHGFFGLDRICRDAVVAQQEVAAELRSLLRVPDRTG
jgi:acetyl esterase